MENPTAKRLPFFHRILLRNMFSMFLYRSTISLILPPSTMDSSIEQTKTFDPNLLFNGTKQSPLLQVNEQNNKHVFINEYEYRL